MGHVSSKFCGENGLNQTELKKWMIHVNTVKMPFSGQIIPILRTQPNNHVDPWTGAQSNLLKRVNLRVSQSQFTRPKMFGTSVEYKRGEWQESRNKYGKSAKLL